MGYRIQGIMASEIKASCFGWLKVLMGFGLSFTYHQAVIPSRTLIISPQIILMSANIATRDKSV